MNTLASTWFQLDEAGPCEHCGTPHLTVTAYQRDQVWAEWDCNVCDRVNEFRMEVAADE